MATDVNDDAVVAPLDVLVVINYIRRNGASSTVPARFAGIPGEISSPRYVDVNSDGFVSPIDVLQVINYLNRRSDSQGEGNTEESNIAESIPDSNGLLTDQALFGFDANHELNERKKSRRQ